MILSLFNYFGFHNMINGCEFDGKPANEELSKVFSLYVVTTIPECDYNVCCYQPIIVNEARFISDRSVVVRPVFASTQARKKHLKELIAERGSLVKLNHDKTLFSGKIIVPESTKDMEIKAVQDYVINTGSLYAVMDDEKLIRAMFSRWLPEAFEKFKLGNILRWAYDDGLEFIEKPKLIIAVHDLINTIPIFDTKHLDGVAVDVRLCYERENRMYDAVRVWYLLSNYEQNIFFIDGEVLCSQTKLTGSRISESLALTENAFKRYSKYQEKGGGKENDKDPFKYLKSGAIDAKYVFSNTSNTSTYVTIGTGTTTSTW